jgi:hypothetical protein
VARERAAVVEEEEEEGSSGRDAVEALSERRRSSSEAENRGQSELAERGRGRVCCVRTNLRFEFADTVLVTPFDSLLAGNGGASDLYRKSRRRDAHINALAIGALVPPLLAARASWVLQGERSAQVLARLETRRKTPERKSGLNSREEKSKRMKSAPLDHTGHVERDSYGEGQHRLCCARESGRLTFYRSDPLWQPISETLRPRLQQLRRDSRSLALRFFPSKRAS